VQTLTITQPDDWHVHLRDEDALPNTVLATAQHFHRALVMPNLKPALTSVAAVLAYRARILAALPPNHPFTPYMTLYLNETISPNDLLLAKDNAHILGAKLYPAGATTTRKKGLIISGPSTLCLRSCKITICITDPWRNHNRRYL